MANLDVPQWVSFTKKWHSKPYEAISTRRTQLSMTGKNVVVTGGGTGIGKATAIAFAEAGAKSVTILGRRSDRLQSSKAEIAQASTENTQVSYEAVDVAVPTQVAKVFANIAERVGNIDVLVNNAGAICPPGPVLDSPIGHLNKVLEANVLTTFNAVQSFLSHAGHSPIVINVTACLVHIQPMPFMGLYAAAKAAQTKFVDYIGAENPHVHVVHLHPGMVTTEIGGPNSDVKGQDEVELPAQFAVWLASEEAGFLNGKLVWANWDVEELEARAEEIKGSRLLTIGLGGIAIHQTNSCPGILGAVVPWDPFLVDLASGVRSPGSVLAPRHGLLPISHRSLVKKTELPSAAQHDRGSNQLRFGEIEGRLDAIEARLRDDAASLPSPSPGWKDQNSAVGAPAQFVRLVTATPVAAAIFSPAQSSANASSNLFELPPSDQVLDLVYKYFCGPNQAIPLFHQPSFMGMLQRWYQAPAMRNAASWAAINVVLALSARLDTSLTSEEFAQECLNKAQSVLNVLVTREEDLQGIQVLLGLVMLFLGTNNPQPTCVLIATAVKLAHRLRLHDKRAHTQTDSETSAQMDRLFWITYILDRDVSLRAVEPYAQHEDDFDVPQPEPACPHDGLGILRLGNTDFNYYYHRVRLAHIQGLVYREAFSVKAGRMSIEQQQAAAEHLTGLIQSWQTSIPSEFRAEQIMVALFPLLDARMDLASLHLAAYHALFMTHHVHARDVDWIRRLTSFSHQFVPIVELDESTTLHGQASPSPGQLLLLPDWMTLVQAARTCIWLIHSIDHENAAFFWSITCVYQTSLIILLANNLTIAQHRLDKHIDSDTRLIDDAMRCFQNTITRQGGNEASPVLASVHLACSELHKRAVIAIRRFRLSWVYNRGGTMDEAIAEAGTFIS
ncbi:transcriptional regulator family: Fungal Specific TF [Purpureocillium lilacinum]|uniref:Transcriptional regulator family: Fungal Specific TF n=1 Tax=Purpureocillium lilacinum TaxID=33203 RepID=A0ABR0BGA8_PURLI|nr:transcriptional regulator family: Fungal Specific TF [Purpureocillium lilacinum]